MDTVLGTPDEVSFILEVERDRSQCVELRGAAGSASVVGTQLINGSRCAFPARAAPERSPRARNSWCRMRCNCGIGFHPEDKHAAAAGPFRMEL